MARPQGKLREAKSDSSVEEGVLESVGTRRRAPLPGPHCTRWRRLQGTNYVTPGAMRWEKGQGTDQKSHKRHLTQVRTSWDKSPTKLVTGAYCEVGGGNQGLAVVGPHCEVGTGTWVW